MDKIVLNGLEFHAYHGVYAEENRFGARFTVDAELFLPLPEGDDLSLTADYSAVYNLIKQQVTAKRFDLIEALASSIASCILREHSNIDAVTVRVHKPHAPLPGVVRDVYVEVHRNRA